MRKITSTAIYLLFSALIICLAPFKTYASTKTYGFSSPNKDYLYSQNKEWWKNIGEGSNVNGSAIAAFATVASVINNKKITPASIAKLAYEKNYWNLSGATPSTLISNLLKEYSNVKSTIAAGSSTSVRISATSKAFTGTKNCAIIVRATGGSPFNTSEKGGHYIVILAYKTDGKIYIYDPATGKLAWKKAKTVYNAMSKNIMFYAVTFSASEESNLELFSPTSNIVEDTTEEDEDDGGQSVLTPTEIPSTPKSSGKSEEDRTKATALADKAIEAAWPIIGNSKGYCYSSSGVYYKWNTYGLDYHNKESCGTNIRQEYREMLNAVGINADSVNERQKVENLFIAIFNAANVDNTLKDYLKNKSLLKYLESNLLDVSNSQLEYGDIIYTGDSYLIYIDNKGDEYGNVVTSKINAEVPHIDDYTLTDNSTAGTGARVFRIGTKTNPEDSSEEGGDGPRDQTPREEQIGDERELSDPESPSPVGERIAARAMSFSWPYTSYSTDDSSHIGKCVAKYKTTETAKKLSSYPAETTKSWKLKTYPTGTKCNKTVTTAYAKYLKLTTVSEYNKQSIASISFVRDVYASLGINLPYSDISELRNKLGDSSDWELITKNATADTEYLPGDLLVSSDAAMIYVGEFGGTYGKVAQAYKGQWTPRLTPLYLKSTYVFRLKSNTELQEGRDCPGLTLESVEGNEKIAVAASNMAWPYRTGSEDKIGKCDAGSKLVSYPSVNSFTITNTKITTKAKTASTLAKEQKNTKCLKTYTSLYDSTVSKLPKMDKKSNLGVIISALYSAGIKQPDPTEFTGKNENEWLYAVLEGDTKNWELVTNNLTSSNKSELLQRGDLIFKVKYSKKKYSYEEVMVYIGKYGKDCLDVSYGNVVTASSSATPHVTKLFFEKKNSYYVFRAKSSAYEYEPTSGESEQEPEPAPEFEPQPQLDPEPTPEPEPEPEPESQGKKIAEVAMSFSWPYSQYNTSDSGLYGKCIYWFPGRTPTNGLVSYPQPYKNGKLSDVSNSPEVGKIGSYYACGNTLTPNRAINSVVGVSGLKGKKYSDVIDTEKGSANYGTYNVGFNATISDLKNKITFQSNSGAFTKYDCIKFVTDVLRAAGVSKKTDVYGSSSLDKQPGWKKIGDSIVNDTKSLKSSSKLVTNQGIELEPGDVIARDANQGKHTFIWLGKMGWPWGDRAEASKGDYSGGLIMDTLISDHVYNYGNSLKVYRYYGE